MLLYPVRKCNTGFTLMEMLVTVIVVGVIAAVASPNLIGMLNRNRVNEAVAQVEGAIKEAQKQAIRQGKACTVAINTADNDNIFSNTGTNNCLLSTKSLKDQIDFYSNISTLTFSGKGNTSVTPNKPTFVVSMSSGTNQQKCVVIENTLGIIRTGDYSGTLNPSNKSNVSDSNCQ